MHRVDDHARQPRGVEHALLLVELPGAVLLRHQPPLQPVGEPGDHALQMLTAAGRDRRAAASAPPRRTARRPRPSRRMRCVKALVDRARRRRRPLRRLPRAARAAVAPRRRRRVIISPSASVVGRPRSSSPRGRARPGASCSASLACAVAALVLAARRLARRPRSSSSVLVLVRSARSQLAELEVEIREQLARGAGEGVLVVDASRPASASSWPTRFLEPRRATGRPSRCAAAAAARAGQPLARHRRDRPRPSAPRSRSRDAVEALGAGTARRAARRDWRATPAMRARAERLDPRLLERVEDRRAPSRSPGSALRCTPSSWWRSRSASASAAPRSCGRPRSAGRSRAGSGSRAPLAGAAPAALAAAKRDLRPSPSARRSPAARRRAPR